MARYESSEPIEIMDRLLWRDAQQMLDRHAEAGRDGRCEWCGWQWPCPPRRLAERAEAASRQAWRDSWTARHDLNDLRTLPSWRAEKPASLDPPPGPAAQPPKPGYAPASSAGAGQPGPGWVPGAATRSGRNARPGPPRSPGLRPQIAATGMAGGLGRAPDKPSVTPAGGLFD